MIGEAVYIDDDLMITGSMNEITGWSHVLV